MADVGSKIKYLFAYRIYNFWIYWFRKHPSSRSYIIYELVERRSLDFFAFQVAYGVHEIEHNTTLLEFFNEKFLLFGCIRFY